VNGAFTGGRLAAPTGADTSSIGGRASISTNMEASGGNTRNVVDGRLVIALAPHKRAVFELGGSALWGQRQFDAVLDATAFPAVQGSFAQAGGDLTMRLGPITLAGEYLRQWGPAARDADYLIGSLRATIKTVTLRLNASYVDYHLQPASIEEWMVQPGVTWNIGWGLSVVAEYDEWRAKNPFQQGLVSQVTNNLLGQPDWRVFDRSLNLIVGYVF
jgi:hypothetical protein